VNAGMVSIKWHARIYLDAGMEQLRRIPAQGNIAAQPDAPVLSLRSSTDYTLVKWRRLAAALP